MVRHKTYTLHSPPHYPAFSPVDEFIDYTEYEEHGGDDNHPSLLSSQRQRIRDMYDDDYVSLIEKLHERAVEGRGGRFGNIYSEQTTDIIRHPGLDDYELWRVACKVCWTLLQQSSAVITNS
jgi:hypothetical protein